jgi:predicted metal-dependent enzyme (double-stranded beta helix superfamily)
VAQERLNPVHPALAPLARAAGRGDFGELEETLAVALARPAWLRPEHRIGDPARYMRHILYVDAADRFVITAITWLPGQVSPRHGHQVWCMFGIAEGTLTEEQFDDGLKLRKTKAYEPGQLADADLHGKVIHRVSNRTERPVVSLHLYGVAPENLTTGINRIYG